MGNLVILQESSFSVADGKEEYKNAFTYKETEYRHKTDQGDQQHGYPL